jgi:hypothetical protein
MAKKRYYLDSRVLSVLFLAAMPFVAFGSFVVVKMASGQLRESLGQGLEQRALQTKISLERYVANRVVDLRLLARQPELLQAVATTDRELKAGEAASLEQAWESGSDSGVLAPILRSPLAARLRDVVEVRPALLKIQVVNRRGRLVAASSPGGKLFYDEAPWFKALGQQEGPAQAWVSDIQTAAGAGESTLEIAYPVRYTDGGWLGAVRGVVNAADIYGVLAPVRVGRTGRALLLRATDGMILASDEADRNLRDVFPGFESLRGAMEGFPLADQGTLLFSQSQPGRGYWTIPAEHGKGREQGQPSARQARLVGYAPVEQVPNVKWLVVVEQSLGEALAPVEGVTRYLWFHFAGALVTILLLAAYISFKLERPVMEERLHLHEEHLPAGAKARDED